MDSLGTEIQSKEKEITILQNQLSLLSLRKQALNTSKTPIQYGGKSSSNLEANTSKTAPQTSSQKPSIEGKTSSKIGVNTSKTAPKTSSKKSSN